MRNLRRKVSWMEDFRWAMNAMRARRWRRELLFERRVLFDDALRPELQSGLVIAYPDAFYRITVDNVLAAMEVSRGPL